MKFVVKDAFGTVRGEGHIKWEPVNYLGGLGSIEDELDIIFPKRVITAELPTINARLPWRFDVYPHE